MKKMPRRLAKTAPRQAVQPVSRDLTSRESCQSSTQVPRQGMAAAHVQRSVIAPVPHVPTTQDSRQRPTLPQQGTTETPCQGLNDIHDQRQNLTQDNTDAQVHETVQRIREDMTQGKRRTSQTKSSSYANNTFTCTEKCDIHPDRIVEYYCNEDHTLGCSVCMTMYHRRCDEVDHIPEISENILDSLELHNFRKNLDTMKVKSQGIVDATFANRSKVNQYFAETGSNLRMLRRKMNEAFDKLELDVRNKAETLKSNDITHLKSVNTQSRLINAEVKKISAHLQGLQRRKRLGQIFIQMMKLQEKVDKLQMLLSKVDASNTVTAYTFEAVPQMNQFLETPTTIGSLSVPPPVRIDYESLAEELFSPPSVPTSVPNVQEVTADQAEEQRKNADHKLINVKTEADRHQCQIIGSARVPDNRLVLADYRNSKVKLIDLPTETITAALTLESGPWGVTSVPGGKIAVTIPASNKICIMEVNENLWLDKELWVEGECRTVLCKDDKLIVGFTDFPRRVDIMTIDGMVTRRFNLDGSIQWLSHMVLAQSRDAIYVADCSSSTTKSIRKISLHGHVRAEYSSEEPIAQGGMALDKQGNVLVCDKLSGNIHVLTPDLQKVRVIPNTLHHCNSLSYCRNSAMLYVGLTGDHLNVVYMPQTMCCAVKPIYSTHV